MMDIRKAPVTCERRGRGQSCLGVGDHARHAAPTALSAAVGQGGKVGVRYAGSLASAACGGDGACKAARRAYGGQAASAVISAAVGRRVAYGVPASNDRAGRSTCARGVVCGFYCFSRGQAAFMTLSAARGQGGYACVRYMRVRRPTRGWAVGPPGAVVDGRPGQASRRRQPGCTSQQWFMDTELA